MLDLGVQIPDVKPPSRPQTEVQGWTATYSDQRTSGLIVMLAPDNFVVVGKAIDVKFSSAGAQPKDLEIDSVEEGQYLDELWVRGRTLNGDELHTILPPDKVGVTRIRLLGRK